VGALARFRARKTAEREEARRQREAANAAVSEPVTTTSPDAGPSGADPTLPDVAPRKNRRHGKGRKARAEVVVTFG
jgi:hypothetical protein